MLPGSWFQFSIVSYRNYYLYLEYFYMYHTIQLLLLHQKTISLDILNSYLLIVIVTAKVAAKNNIAQNVDER